MLHTGQEHGGNPDIAQHHKTGRQQHPEQNALFRKQEQRYQQRKHAGNHRHQQGNAAIIGENQILSLLESTVGTEAGKRQLYGTGEHKTGGDQIRHRNLELGHGDIRYHCAQTENTDDQDADN